MPRLGAVLVGLTLVAGAGCRAHQAINADKDMTTRGTIAGQVVEENGDPVQGRRVHAVHVGSTQRYSAVSSVTGGFSIPVPPGDYRLEIELQPGEVVKRDPGLIHINKSDLDAQEDIVIGPG
jgi:hypothetical protein